MQKAKVIIGANYGDEGKGLMTDYFASLAPEDSLIVRYNGGAQAGHTVQSPDGRRHVFSHFGSASFLNCPTFLSSFFIVNPMLFVRELRDLRNKNVYPQVFIDPAAFVSTPFDIFINQLLETQRAGKRHGSCGIGINETVTRCLSSADSRLQVKDLFNTDLLESKLLNLKEKWLPARLRQHGIDNNCEAVKSFISIIEPIIEQYICDVNLMLNSSHVSPNCISNRKLIFEGAQGLMLDEMREDQFPHVTRSRTGLTNVLTLARRFDIDELDVTYVSRTYLTRHGAGPLKGEDEFCFPDATNVPNQFQGSLRFAKLDLTELRHSIELDLKAALADFPQIKAHLALSCADQMSPPDEKQLPLPLKYLSFGPSRECVKESAAKTIAVI